MIIYIISIAENFRNNDDKNDNKNNKSENENALNEMLSKITRFDLKSEVKKLPKFVAIAIKGKGKAKKKARKSHNAKFKKFLKLPNMHAGFHLANNTKKYTTIMNSNILTKKLKHKLFTLFSSYQFVIANDYLKYLKIWQTQRLHQT